jgi:hypothetical protein
MRSSSQALPRRREPEDEAFRSPIPSDLTPKLAVTVVRTRRSPNPLSPIGAAAIRSPLSDHVMMTVPAFSAQWIDRRNGKGNIDETAVLALPNCLV